MRKIILFNLITLDGYFEGQNRDISWHNVDKEFDQFAVKQLKSASTLIFGRVTYELMADFWPTPNAIAEDPAVAEKMNKISKIVISSTLTNADWKNTRLIKGEFVDEIRRLKKKLGKDMYIFGSSDLAVSLLRENLIDEIRVIVNPLFLGSGKPLLQGLQKRLALKLIKTKVFKNGNVLLYYSVLK